MYLITVTRRCYHRFPFSCGTCQCRVSSVIAYVSSYQRPCSGGCNSRLLGTQFVLPVLSLSPPPPPLLPTFHEFWDSTNYTQDSESCARSRSVGSCTTYTSMYTYIQYLSNHTFFLCYHHITLISVFKQILTKWPLWYSLNPAKY